jgi:hypothetical protein
MKMVRVVRPIAMRDIRRRLRVIIGEYRIRIERRFVLNNFPICFMFSVAGILFYKRTKKIWSIALKSDNAFPAEPDICPEDVRKRPDCIMA